MNHGKKTAAAAPFANADGSLGALLDKEPLLSNKRPPRRNADPIRIEANEVLYKFLPDPTRIQPTTGVSLSDVHNNRRSRCDAGLPLSWPPLRGAGIGRRLSLCYTAIDEEIRSYGYAIGCLGQSRR